MSINFGGIGEAAEGLTSTDPTLGTCSPSEAAIRNSLPFTDIRIGFPTLGAASAGNWAKQGLQRGLDSITATNSITFPAYIKQFKDDFRPNWNSVPVFGRPDQIPIFSNTERSITLSLLILSSDMAIASRGVFLRRAATSAGAILPRALELTFTFTVLHERTPGFDASTGRFIGEGAIMGGDYPYRTISSFGGANPRVDQGGVDKDVADKVVLGHSSKG